MPRKSISSGSYLEPIMGFSRAVRVGNHVSVAGTAPIAPEGGTAAVGDVYGQLKRCIEISAQALKEAGASLEDVVRTRIMLTDISQWKEAAKAHGEVFGDIRPVITVVEVSAFVEPEWLVETEMDAVIAE
ncbi:MAG: RidA family protein [Pseudomonadota bacterium]